MAKSPVAHRIPCRFRHGKATNIILDDPLRQIKLNFFLLFFSGIVAQVLFGPVPALYIEPITGKLAWLLPHD